MPASPQSNSSAAVVFTSSTDNDFEKFSAKKVFLFPGQGAQTVGMGSESVKASAKAKELFLKAEKILGYDLLQLCTSGPKASLDKTEVCQPAIFVHSMAAIERLREEKGSAEVDSATVCLGLSLGEYSALCYAGAITFDDCVRITKERGAAMQEAAELKEGGMVSVIGLSVEEIEKMLQSVESISGEKLKISNYLCEGNYVVSGGLKALQLVEKIAKPEFNAKMTFALAVTGAFHTEMMQPAVERLNKVLDDVEIKKPRIPVVSNVDAKPHSDPEVIRQLLKKQIVSSVQWETSMKSLFSRDYESSYELGTGTVLKGIITRMDSTKGKTVTCIA